MEDIPRLVARGYDRVAAEYARLEKGQEWPRLRWLERVLAGLGPHSAVLDLGCGNGVPALETIVARGHRAVGVDVSTVQVGLAQRNVPGAEVLRADALELDFPPGSFDAVVSFYVFDHVPRDRQGELLGRMRRWLEDGGTLLVTFEGGGERESVDEWLGVPMVFSHHDEETSVELVAAAGFEIEDRRVQIQREGSDDVPFLWVLARAG